MRFTGLFSKVSVRSVADEKCDLFPCLVYLQEPSETDKRAVRDDPDLKSVEYVGEYVISQAIIYLISPAGQVREIDDTQTVFTE
jgi:hypothetical protein